MNVLVTGGAGFFGSSVVKHLEKRNYKVVVLDDLSTGSMDNLSTFRGEFVLGSILDSSLLEITLNNIDAVIHMAVRNIRESITAPINNFEVNATGTLLLLEKCKKKSINKFIYCSSSEVYGNAQQDFLDCEGTICRPSTVYGAGKYSGEILTKSYGETYGRPFVIIRPFNVYGPNASKQDKGSELITRFVFQRLRNLPFTIYGDGTQSRDFTFVDDSARWMVNILENYERVKYRTLNLGSGFAPSVYEVAQIISNLIRPDSPVNFQYMDSRPGDIQSLKPELSKTRQFIDLTTEYNFEQGVRIVADAFRNLSNLQIGDKNW